MYSYSDQDLQHYTKTYGVQTIGTYSCCLYAVSLGIVSLGRCSLVPSRVGLRTYQHPCAVLGYYIAQSGNSVPTFRDNLLVPFSRVKKSGLLLLLGLLNLGRWDR